MADIDRGCPCLYTAPCDPRCTCLHPHSSRGCRRCCTYGSLEQRTAMAEHLAAQERYIVQLRDALVSAHVSFGEVEVRVGDRWMIAYLAAEEILTATPKPVDSTGSGC